MPKTCHWHVLGKGNDPVGVPSEKSLVHKHLRPSPTAANHSVRCIPTGGAHLVPPSRDNK